MSKRDNETLFLTTLYAALCQVKSPGYPLTMRAHGPLQGTASSFTSNLSRASSYRKAPDTERHGWDTSRGVPRNKELFADIKPAFLTHIIQVGLCLLYGQKMNVYIPVVTAPRVPADPGFGLPSGPSHAPEGSHSQGHVWGRASAPAAPSHSAERLRERVDSGKLLSETAMLPLNLDH